MSVAEQIEEQSEANIKFFLSQPVIRRNTIVQVFNWLAASFNYYMVVFLLKYFPGEIYYNSAASCISEVVACLVAG